MTDTYSVNIRNERSSKLYKFELGDSERKVHVEGCRCDNDK